MGQAVGTLLGKREDVNVPEGVESHYVVVDKTVFRRRVRLEFTLLHPKDQTEEEEAEVERQEAAAAEAFASKAMIEEVSSQWSVVADEEGAAERTLAPGAGDDDLPPLAFVDENDEDHLACRPVGPVRRAHSTGTAPSSAAGQDHGVHLQQQKQKQRRPPRPQSVGALRNPGSSQGRLSLQSVTEAVCVGGKEMSRLRLSLVSRCRRPSEDVSGRADEEEMVVLGTTSVLLPSSSERGAEKGQRRCESVTVSLEAVASGEAAAAVAEGGEAAVNVEIEQAEVLKPIEQLSAEQTTGVPIVQSSPELQLAVQRLCQSYSRDEHSPSVVASKRDVRIITAFLLRLIAPATTEGTDASEGPQLLSAGSSHSSLPPLPALSLQSPTPTTAAATPSQDTGEGHTPIPAPPASPFGAEPIIEASGGAKPSTATATTTTMAAPVPPPKPVRRRKIRLSASEAELLGGPAGAGEEATGAGAVAAAGGGAEGLFDDLWGVEPSPSPKPKPAKAAGKKKLLAPEESATIPDHELSMWS